MQVRLQITYEELLHRSNGKYDYQLHIQPQNQIIEDFKINIKIDESLPLKDITVKRLKSRGEVQSKAEDITTEALGYVEKKKALIDFSPSLKQQESGKDWKLVMNYDIEKPVDGNDIQIDGGKFIHYFSPDNLPTKPKHVIFFVDVSGSMVGRKIEQTKDAMTEIILN